MAHEIIEGGIYHCMPYMCIGNEYDVGALISAHEPNRGEDTGEVGISFSLTEMVPLCRKTQRDGKVLY